MENKYTVDYFIEKFEVIPEDRWCTGRYNGPNDTHCAIGHCDTGQFYGEEEIALMEVFGLDFDVVLINDGKDSRYHQPTPKQRILTALHDVKNKLNNGK